MPRGDGTGPAGMGPMTGRAAGYCAGYDRPGFANPVGGRLGGGFSRGRGRSVPINYNNSGGYYPQYGRGFIPPYAQYPYGTYGERGWRRGRSGGRGPVW